MADLDDEAPRLEDIARAIATIEDSRQTHVEWIDYLARHGDDLRPHEEIAGDAGHHREAVEQYEQVLSVLRASAAPVPEGVPEDRIVPEGWRVEWTAGSPWWNGKPRLVPVFPSVDPEEGSSEAADHAAIAYLRNRGVTDPDSVDPEEG